MKSKKRSASALSLTNRYLLSKMTCHLHTGRDPVLIRIYRFTVLSSLEIKIHLLDILKKIVDPDPINQMIQSNQNQQTQRAQTYDLAYLIPLSEYGYDGLVLFR